MSEHRTPPTGDDTPLGKAFTIIMGASATDAHATEPPGADAKSIAAGHEPDTFDAKAILYVPLGVVIAVGVTYAVVTAVFSALDIGVPLPPDATSHPAVADQNKRSLDERFADISSSDPTAAVKEPRLEYLKKLEPAERTRPGKDKPDPEYLRSFRPDDTGNPPEVRPEDLRPANYVDWQSKEKPLVDAKALPNGFGRLPIADAIALLAADSPTKADGLRKKYLPTKAGAAYPPATTDWSAKLSNSGRGGYATPVAAPAKPEDAKPAVAPKH